MARIGDRTLLNSGRAGLSELNKSIATDLIEETILKLVKIRASQINGGAFFLTLHTRAALG